MKDITSQYYLLGSQSMLQQAARAGNCHPRFFRPGYSPVKTSFLAGLLNLCQQYLLENTCSGDILSFQWQNYGVIVQKKKSLLKMPQIPRESECLPIHHLTITQRVSLRSCLGPSVAYVPEFNLWMGHYARMHRADGFPYGDPKWKVLNPSSSPDIFPLLNCQNNNKKCFSWYYFMLSLCSSPSPPLCQV